MLPSIRPELRWVYRLWKVRMVGEALNFVLPAASMGGEPVKVVLLKSSHGIGYHEGASSGAAWWQSGSRMWTQNFGGGGGGGGADCPWWGC